MNEDKPVLLATTLKPIECAFQHCIPCVYLPDITLLGV